MFLDLYCFCCSLVPLQISFKNKNTANDDDDDDDDDDKLSLEFEQFDTGTELT